MNTINWTRNRELFRNYKRLIDRKTNRHRKKSLMWMMAAMNYGIKVPKEDILPAMRVTADLFLGLYPI